MNTSGATELKAVVGEGRNALRTALIFSAISSLLVLAPSVYMLEVYDRVVNSRSHTTLIMLTIAVLFAFVVMEILEWVRAEVMRSAGDQFDHKLRQRVFNAIFVANLRKLPGGTPQPMADLRTVRDFHHSPALLAAMDAPVSLVFLALLFAVSPLLGWTALFFAVAQSAITWANEVTTREPLMAANRSAIQAQQYADNTMRNAEVIESMGMLGGVHRNWMLRQAQMLQLQAKASLSAGVFQALSKFTQHVLASALLGLATWLFLHDKLAGGGGMLIVASILGGRVLTPLIAVVTHWQMVVNVRDAWQRLTTLLTSLPRVGDAMPLPKPIGQLDVEPLVVPAPGTQALILQGVTFSLKPGEVLAVVGPSASGKSTLARVLVGLWPSSGGKVRLDGADIHAWNKEELGPSIGYLPQGVELVEGSIAENIARFGDADEEALAEALRAAGLTEWVATLPDGVQTSVGPDGLRLSGGQRQRIALARALYGRPVFVVMDEPNSSLDEAGDLALVEAIRSYKASGTTFVVVTHRTNVLSVVDRILVLREGRMQGVGPRDDVLKALTGQRQAAATPGEAPGGTAVAPPDAAAAAAGA